MRSYAKSLAHFERAKKVTPGASQTSSKAPGHVGPIGAFPLFLARCEGPYSWDLDGNRFIDLFNGNCAVVLGHGDLCVETEVALAMTEYGCLPSLPTVLEAEVAEKLVELIPCAEQVRFTKTGSEATEAAVRIARCATGRQQILTLPGMYHGWHSGWQVNNPQHPGVPEFYWDGWRQIDDVRWLRDELRPRYTAAIILEPAGFHDFSREDLQALIDTAHAHGTLVIFDEMITGMRYDAGGIQRKLGVTPDLATFGKAYGNGHPIAFVCGSAELMQHAQYVSGTFGGEVTGLAAAKAVLEIDAAESISEEIAIAGASLMGFLRSAGLPSCCKIAGTPYRFAVKWSGPQADVLTALWQQALAEHGILAHPSGWNPSAAMNVEVLREAAVAIELAMADLHTAIDSGHPETFLRGELIRAAMMRPA